MLLAYRFWFITLILLLGQKSWSQQIPVGLYEGMLGNSGAALSDSTAASQYNPSLLRNRTDHSFSIDGNAFGSLSSRSSGSEFSSLSLTPSYIGSVISGTALVHEFFLTTLSSGPIKAVSQANPSSTLTESIDLTKVRMGYSMAFKSIPFALQFLGRYSQSHSLGFLESSDETTTTTGKIESNNQYLGASLGVSGHVRFESYSIGFNFLSRGLDLYKNSKGTQKTFTYGTSLLEQESSFEPPTSPEAGHLFTVGQEFKTGSHQFLTDSVLAEDSGLNHNYTFTQSFGYKFGSASGHQLLCGLNHRLGPEIYYFGQSIFASVGYSWLTRSLRSAIGLYHYSSKIEAQTVSTLGISFGSEFGY
jgi:hypothetical protein